MTKIAKTHLANGPRTVWCTGDPRVDHWRVEKWSEFIALEEKKRCKVCLRIRRKHLGDHADG